MTAWRRSGSSRWKSCTPKAGTIHPVVWVPWDEAEARLAAPLAAGGRLVRHDTEELFWTLADPAGNEVDIATVPAPDPAQP